jgi:hypothetical protein
MQVPTGYFLDDHLIWRANGNQSFNIFDTGKLPLSAEHLSEVTALCHLLVGVSADSDKDKAAACGTGARDQRGLPEIIRHPKAF